MEKRTKSIQSQLKKFPEVLAVSLFGSSVYGKKSRLSDFDVGVIFKEPESIINNPKKSLKTYERLFDTFVPLIKDVNKIDLVFLQKAQLSLQKEVLLTGKLIYCQNQEKFLDYKEKTLLRYADIKPLLSHFYHEVYNTRL